MTDKFEKFPSNIESPAKSAFAITPVDGADLAVSTRAIYVGGSGDIVVILEGDATTVTFKSVVAGTVLPIRVKQLHAALTTATDIIGLY